MSQQAKVLEMLFVSRVRIKLLNYLFRNAVNPVHLRGAVRDLDEEINAVRRELMRMEEIKLVNADVRGNRKYYLLNPKAPFKEELRNLVFKSTGLGAEIIEESIRLGDIKFAFLGANFLAGGEPATDKVDLVIIGEPNMQALHALISKIEQDSNRQINYAVLKTSEFESAKKRRDAFVTSLIVQTKAVLIGDPDELFA